MNPAKNVLMENLKNPVVWVILILILLPACSTIEKTVYQDKWHANRQIDSIFVHEIDSITLHQRGDTVYLEKISIRYRDKFIYHADTVYQQIKVSEPYPVEKKLSKWQNLLINTGVLSLGIIFILAVFFGLKIWLSKK